MFGEQYLFKLANFSNGIFCLVVELIEHLLNHRLIKLYKHFHYIKAYFKLFLKLEDSESGGWKKSSVST